MSHSSILLPRGFREPPELSGLPEDTPILIGFSGGSDSSALLFLLSEWSKKSGAPLSVAHVNHGIRGAEADRDEEFCREAAASLGLPFYSAKADVPALAKEYGESIEACARRVRYAFFDRVMREHHIPILATAHNANDNLETVLFNMARGAGLGGICGIPASRPTEHGILIRPMLRMEKEAVLALCKEERIDFVSDATNTDTDYTRNKIRAELIPVLREINPRTVRNVSNLCESLHEDSLCLITMANWFLEEMKRDNAIEVEKLCGSPPAVVNRALMTLFETLSDGFTLEYTHVMSLRRLCRAGVPHSSLSLPGGMEAVIEDGFLIFRKKQSPTVIPDYEAELREGRNPISQTNTEIVIGNSQNKINVYKKSILLYLDSDKINGTVLVRKRRGGDTVRVGGMTKSLKKLMCEKKIPLPWRDRLPVLCDSNGILAVPFVAVRDGLSVSETTDEHTLRVEFYLYE